MPERQARAEPGQARHPAATAYLRADVDAVVLQHGGPGGRRLHAGARWRCAARSRWRYDVERRDPHRAARPGDPGAVDRAAARPAGYDPALQDRDERATTRRAREGAARPVRLRRPRRRRLARAARRHRRWCSSTRPSPTSSRASSTSCGRRAWTRSASASSFKTAQWPENLKAARAGKLMMWRRRLVGRHARRRRRPRARATAAQIGRRQPGALRAAGVRRAVRADADRCPTAPSAQALFDEAKRS